MTKERWSKLSFVEQMGNIGSEVSRAGRWKGRDEKSFWGVVERGLELFNLTLEDPRWKNRRQEIGRAHEMFCDAVFGGQEYGTTFQNLQPYFDHFALATRRQL